MSRKRSFVAGGLFAAAGVAGASVYDAVNFVNDCNLSHVTSLPEPSYEAVSGEATYICPGSAPNCGEEEALAIFYSGSNSNPVSLSRIDDALEMAVLANEDRSFYTTREINGAEKLRDILGRAAIDSAQAMSLVANSGASGIEMQLVRNYWPEAMPNNDVCRKILEITLGQYLIDQVDPEPVVDGYGRVTYPDKAILLQDYLNTVYFGRGAWGIEAAAQVYFGKSAANLSVLEAATLAGIPKSPDSYDGSTDASRDAQQQANLLARRNETLDNLVEFNAFSREEIEPLKAEPLGIKPYQLYNQAPYADYARTDELGLRHFVEETKLAVMEQLGLSDEEFRSNLRINTTIDANIQRAVVEAVRGSGIPADGRQVAVVVLGQDGSLLAEYGGDWANSQVNLAETEGPVGSSLKPYISAQALNAGILGSLNEIVTEQPGFTWSGVDINSSDFKPDEGYVLPGGSGTAYDALAYSSNIIPLQLLYEQEELGLAGLESTAALMRSFGMQSDSPAVPAMATGWWETSVYSLATGMNGLIGNQGTAVPAHEINGVTDVNAGYTGIDNGVFVPAAPHTVVSPEIAAQITEAGRGTMDYGTAAGIMGDVNGDIAGKTGSVPNNSGAFITVVVPTASGNITIAVGMRHVEGLVNMGPGSTGGNWPARIAENILNTMIDPSRSLN